MSIFDEAVHISLDGNTATCHTHPAFDNMVGPFGGVTAATVLNAVLAHPEVHGRPAAVTLNYTAPLENGEFTLDLQLVKTNRSNQHWLVTGHQGDAVPLSATVVLAIDRDGFAHTEAVPPRVPAPAEVAPAPAAEGFPWVKNYDFRFVEGGFDVIQLGASEFSRSTFWIRDVDERPWDYQSLMSVSDSFFPRVFLALGAPVPAGTISITTYFHAGVDQLAALDGYLLATALASSFGNGLHDQQAQLWSEKGELLVTSSQLVYFKTLAPRCHKSGGWVCAGRSAAVR